jgi:hypothetical protein
MFGPSDLSNVSSPGSTCAIALARLPASFQIGANRAAYVAELPGTFEPGEYFPTMWIVYIDMAMCAALPCVDSFV